MQLIISLPEETDLIENDQLGELPQDFIDDLSEIDSNVKFKSLNIGPGADWIAVLAIFSGLFFLGEKIEKNLTAWMKLGKKLLSLREKHARNWVFVDEKGATALCLVDIAKSEKNLSEIEEVDSSEIRVLDIHSSTLNYKDDQVKMNPYSIYNKTFLVNNERYYIYVILSNGDIRSKIKIDSLYLDMFKK